MNSHRSKAVLYRTTLTKHLFRKWYCSFVTVWCYEYSGDRACAAQHMSLRCLDNRGGLSARARSSEDNSSLRRKTNTINSRTTTAEEWSICCIYIRRSRGKTEKRAKRTGRFGRRASVGHHTDGLDGETWSRSCWSGTPSRAASENIVSL